MDDGMETGESRPVSIFYLILFYSVHIDMTEY